MSSTVNIGGQQIGWKYSTPLQAEYLDTFISGITNPGLVTRPNMTAVATGDVGTVTIKPFSLFIEPNDKINESPYDENNKRVIKYLIKVTTTVSVSLEIGTETVAIGFDFQFAKDSIPQSQWYGTFKALSMSEAETYEGIIIATVCNVVRSDNQERIFSVRTNGADISDVLLREEGFDPHCWLSVVSPRRMSVEKGGTGLLNRLELRTHNELYEGYINGYAGCLYQDNLHYDFTGNTDTDKIRGIEIPGIYNVFSHNTEGLSLSDYTDVKPTSANPLLHTSGSPCAVVDCSDIRQIVGSTPGFSWNTAFVNRVKIKPCVKENVNIYIDDNIMYIK